MNQIKKLYAWITGKEGRESTKESSTNHNEKIKSYQNNQDREIELLTNELLSSSNNCYDTSDLFLFEQLTNHAHNNDYLCKIEDINQNLESDSQQNSVENIEVHHSESEIIFIKENDCINNDVEKSSTSASKTHINYEKDKTLAGIYSFDGHLDKLQSLRSSQGCFDYKVQFHNKNSKQNLLRCSMSSEVIEIQLSQDSNRETFTFEKVEYIEDITNPEQSIDQEKCLSTAICNKTKEASRCSIDDIKTKIQQTHHLELRINTLGKEIECFELQFEDNDEFMCFIDNFNAKIQGVSESIAQIQSELLRIENNFLIYSFDKEEINLLNESITTIDLQIKHLYHSIDALECEFKEFEMAESKVIFNFISDELDIFLSQYDELNERISPIQAEICKLLNLFNIMNLKEDYQDKQLFIQESILSLQLEQQRVNIIKEDCGKLTEILQKYKNLQVNQFGGITYEAMREMRRHLGNMEPNIFNKQLIEEELNSILEIRERLMNICNDLGDANVQEIIHQKAIEINKFNRLLDSCEQNAEKLDDAIVRIKSNSKIFNENKLSFDKIEKRIDSYFEEISKLNKICEEDNQRLEYLKEVIEDISNYDIVEFLVCSPSHYYEDCNQHSPQILVEEMDLLGKDISSNIEISLKINSDLATLLRAVSKEKRNQIKISH